MRLCWSSVTQSGFALLRVAEWLLNVNVNRMSMKKRQPGVLGAPHRETDHVDAE